MGANSPFAGLRGRRVLVTGGAGFIGARLVHRAVEAGATVTAVVRASSSTSRLARLVGATLATTDVCDEREMAAVVRQQRPHLIFHLAAIADWRRDPALTSSMVRTHVLATTHLLELAREAGVERIVLFGSAGEYGAQNVPLCEDFVARPADPYSVSKLCATEIALMYQRVFALPSTVVRPFVVYGPGESERRLLPSVFAAASAGKATVDFTSGEQLLDFVHVDDVVDGALRAGLCPNAVGEILNLGTGTATSVRDAVTRAIEISGNVVQPRFGARPQRAGEPQMLLADVAKTRRVLGWYPATVLTDGLRAVWNSWSQRERPNA